jgi:2-polyprenyl-3-methyl-5-hydroxy-6-metoxy-1,4-benzoquinol methylase
MEGTLARYDEFAEWYEHWTADFGPPLIAAQAELLPPLAGLRVLDLACGHGRLSRELARGGAEVVGVDQSAGLLDLARARDSVGVDYIQADVTEAPRWWDGRPFDGCTCELALMDIDDFAGALATVTTVVRPGGWFVASIVHPCFPGSDSGLSSWPVDGGYDDEVWWTSSDHNPNGARRRVGATHRKLATYVNGLLNARLELEFLAEPPAPVPTFLLWRCRRR